MWTVYGKFVDGDDVEREVPSTHETRLLKTGKSYMVGRKSPAPLCINSKRVSRTHVEFVVDSFTADDVTNPVTKPRLRGKNLALKPLTVERAGGNQIIAPQTTLDLLDGDILVLSSHDKIRVTWTEVCCYENPPRTKSSFVNVCASLGLHVVHTQPSTTTHYLTHELAAIPPQAVSLVHGSHFVTPNWLDEILRLGDLPKNSDLSKGVALEQAFVLPPTTKYWPSFGSDLPAAYKSFGTWAPNEARMHMFSKHWFLCVGEKEREISGEMRELIDRAQGKVSTFNVEQGEDKWRKTLVRLQAKQNVNLVLLGNTSACEAAVGRSNWQELVSVADAFRLRFHSHDDLIRAILDANTKIFNEERESQASASSLPEIVYNTLEDEKSIASEIESAPPPVRRLTRRTASRQASQELVPAAAETAPPPPPKKLTRRVQVPMLTGLDDSSFVIDSMTQSSAAPISIPEPAPAKPRSKLKRRVGTVSTIEAESDISLAVTGIESVAAEEPPLKKFKALFEASNPSNDFDSIDQSGAFDEDGLLLSDSQTQSVTQTQTAGRSGRHPTALRSLPEEDEESQPVTVSRKRKERSADADDEEMAGIAAELYNPSGGSIRGSTPALKKRATGSNAVQPATAKTPLPTTKLGKKPSAAAAAGAAAGQPDTDEAFLQAIASTRRGKKTEDEFDRDFNKLKIKADVKGAAEIERPAWEIVDSFGDETDLRGNFMVIQDLEVYKLQGEGRKQVTVTNPLWEGKPDFKKFKQKANKSSTAALGKKFVDLVISEDSYRIGDDDFQNEFSFQDHEASKIKQKGREVFDHDEALSDQSSVVEPPKKRGTQPPKQASSRTARTASRTPAPLFLEDSDEEQQFKPTTRGKAKAEPFEAMLDMDDDMDVDQTLRSASLRPSRQSAQARGAKRKVVSESENEEHSDSSSDAGNRRGKNRKKRARR